MKKPSPDKLFGDIKRRLLANSDTIDRSEQWEGIADGLWRLLTPSQRKKFIEPHLTESGALYGVSLEEMPDSSDHAVFHTHFDCWPGGEDSEYSDKVNRECWENPKLEGGWRHPSAVALAYALLGKAKALGVNTDSLVGEYLALGQEEFFNRLAILFHEASYDTYNSDTVFEAYPAGESE